MGVDTIMFIIFLFIVVFGGAIKKMLEALQEQTRVEAEAEPDFEATPEQIRDFLQSLEQEGQREARAPQRGAPQAPAPPRAESAEEVSFRAPTAAQRRPASERAAEPGEGPPVRRAAQPGAPAPPRKAEPARAPTLTAEELRGFDLRKAVVWAEILGRPVSMRRDRRTAR